MSHPRKRSARLGVHPANWADEVLRQAAKAVAGEKGWSGRLADRGRRVHLAVLTEPYLSLLILELKTIESRFSKTRRAPWQCVSSGDLILLKRLSGPVVGLAEVGTVWECEIGGDRPLTGIRAEFGKRICAEEAFWAGCNQARYATLMQIRRICAVKDIQCDKRDRRGWVVLRGRA